ncbi:MAG: sigma-70 family RNA polymerase sigma factor [bacterium]|nr:sigma-70 family RNA polymerase sigma factor [bacterium]
MNDVDKACYRAFLNNEIQGFEQLVIKYKDHVIYFVRRYVNDIHIAEDVAQDAFVDVYLYKERYDFSSSFKTYLFTIARNKAVDYVRRNAKHMNQMVLEDMEVSDDEKTLEEKVITDEMQKMLHENIRKLKPEIQVLINLTYFEQMSGKEVAKILGMTEGQVKVKLHRARKQLAEILGKDAYQMLIR